MTDWSVAVHATADGCRLDLDVHPGRRRAAFPTGLHPWRRRIGIDVRAPAQEGKANREVLAAVASFFQVPGAKVLLVSGAKDGRKVVDVQDLSLEEACRRLAEALP